MGKKAKQKQGKKTNSNKKQNGQKVGNDDDEESPRGRGARRDRNGPGTRKNGMNRKERNGKGSTITIDDGNLRRMVEGDGSKEILDMADDGNCLFRSLSDQLYYDFGNRHSEVRSEVCDYLAAHEEEFSVFLVLDEAEEDEDAADFETYVSNMRQDGEWGGNLELVVAARLYRRRIKVFSANLAALTLDHGSEEAASGPDMMVSYHDNSHYNSVRDRSLSKPPPPSKHFTKPTTETMEVGKQTDDLKSVDETEIEDAGSVLKDNSDCQLQNTEGIKAKTDSYGSTGTSCALSSTVKKSAPCPCGSGLRYKKCCLAKEKRDRRLERIKKAVQSDAESSALEEDDDDDQEMDSGFRVLHI